MLRQGRAYFRLEGRTISRRNNWPFPERAHMRATINIHVSGVTVAFSLARIKSGAWHGLNNKHACDEVISVINIDLAPVRRDPCRAVPLGETAERLPRATDDLRPRGGERPSKLPAVTPAPWRKHPSEALVPSFLESSREARTCYAEIANIPPRSFRFRPTSFNDTSSRALSRRENVTDA